MDRKQLDVNLFDRSVIDDPWPLYEQIRETGPVVWNGLANAWLVCGYAECAEIFADNGERFSATPANPDVLPWLEAPTMISTDGAEHQRLRAALAPMFTRRAADRWEARVVEVVDELLAPLASGGEQFDLISDFTMVPTIVVTEMLGVPEERHADFMRWSHTIVSNLSFGHENEEAREVLHTTAHEINVYLREEIERHRREKPDDLFTTMIEASGPGAMSDDEIRAAAVLLLLAGYDTTAKLMSNALVAFEAHPETRRELAEHPELMPDAIEEVLRYQSTIQVIPRLAACDTVLAGTEIAKGDAVYGVLGAANRDPRRWDNPQVFDIHRPRQANFGFGYGSHLCLGAPLARMEAKVALNRLLEVAPEYRLRDIDLGPSFFVRGPQSGRIETAVMA
jgi:cytochrome P450